MAVYTGVTINYYGKRYGNWRFSWSYIIGWVSVVLTFFSGKPIFSSFPLFSRDSVKLQDITQFQQNRVNPYIG